jgi:hypothetical protein
MAIFRLMDVSAVVVKDTQAYIFWSAEDRREKHLNLDL